MNVETIASHLLPLLLGLMFVRPYCCAGNDVLSSLLNDSVHDESKDSERHVRHRQNDAA